MKDEHEFDVVDQRHDWSPDDSPDAWQQILTRDPEHPEILTRLVRWAPGYDRSHAGAVSHPYHEEVYLLDGELEDLTLRQTFRAGGFASRPPGMVHGPYRSIRGCLMLETRADPALPDSSQENP